MINDRKVSAMNVLIKELEILLFMKYVALSALTSMFM